MDLDAINAAGLAPAMPLLAKINAIQSREDMAKLMAQPGFSGAVGGYVDVDNKQPDQYIFYLTQTGIGLPDRNYYLQDNEKNREIQTAYKAYLAFLLGKAGYQDAAAAAESVYALEVKIAQHHWDRAIGRNRNLTYNKLDRAQLVELGGDFPIMAMLAEGGIADQDHFVVRQLKPDAEELAAENISAEDQALLGEGVGGLFALMANEPIATWQAYLAAHMLSDFAATLPEDIDQANFEFYGKMLRGQPEQRPRWKRAVETVESMMGKAVGKIYAERHFPPENKVVMTILVENLRKAMAANLKDIDWMSEDTKKEAADKLAKFTPKIGYPNEFEQYQTLEIESGNAFANALATQKWAIADNFSNLGKPIDKDEWFMNPQTVNAYYSSNRNEIVFPAAILQPPFFNLSADDAVNYGAIGGVIGHEMGHGFDDQGSKSDGDGQLRNWWSDTDRANFEKLTDALVAQYNAMCPLDEGNTCVNGQLTLGENIGDVGGLSMAWRAYQISLDGKEAPVIDGLTGAQRFFLGWAQVWRNKSREAYLRQQLQTDPHSPADYRVNGVLRNFDEWYAAFNVSEDDALYLPPEQRIRIW